MLNDQQVRQAADNLWQAEQTSEWAQPISILFPEADVGDAYRVSLAVRDLKVAAGRSVKGHKIGLTSKAMRDLTGATEPDYGFIFDNWFALEGSTVQRSAMNRPLVEVELAFVMGKELKGPSINAADVIRATEFVLPALEIVDSRYKGRGNNLLVDSISDAATCGFVVLGGNPVKLTDVDVRRLSASLSINGQVMESGSASAVMGNPINAVVWLANKLHEFGVAMQPGDVILSGSFVKAIPFGAGDTVMALYDQLGEVILRVA
jgi:2-oxo-hept-3-ene-1,7-dioate hydratase/2-keto-4-pentenoate hydratase